MFDALINILGVPLGFIMKVIYDVVKNYGVAIILFTLVTKLILFPISYKQQKNAARQQLLNPKLVKLREKYQNDPNRFALEQTKLMQEENINPYSSCLTSFIPLILLWGVLAVVYKPMTYIMHYDKAVIEEARAVVLAIDDDRAGTLDTLNSNRMREELIIMERLIKEEDEFRDAIRAGKVATYDEDGNEGEPLVFTEITPDFVDRVSAFADTFYIGKTNLAETPSFKFKENSSVFLFLIPILSGLVQFLMTIYMQVMQKKKNPGMPSMGLMNIMLYIMPIFSIWVTYTVPAGVGFYWLCSSVFSFLQSIFLYSWFNDERVEKIGEAERKKAKKARRRPSMMQLMVEQQEELMRQQGQAAGSNAKLGGGPANRVRYSDDDGERHFSRSEIEEYNSAVIREARKRIAEKYGDTEALEQQAEEAARVQKAKTSKSNKKKKK